MNQLTFAVTEQDFATEVLASDLPVLVEFTADWCPPCKMIAPIINQIASEYEGQLRVGVLDSDANPALVQAYGVMGLPTMILFVDGAPAERIIGYMPRPRIESKLRPHLAMEKV